jgi:hypothetical protein
MSMILYYSNYCNNCRELLPVLSQSQVKNDIHFICIDNRVKKADGSTYIILQNQQEIILPNTVDKVPALLLLNRGNQVIYGENIKKQLYPVKAQTQEVVSNLEPDAFSFCDMNASGVTSDNFSFLDQDNDSLSAKGDGGLRQLRNNMKLDDVDQIETPPDDYTPNKVGEVSMDELQSSRAQALK